MVSHSVIHSETDWGHHLERHSERALLLVQRLEEMLGWSLETQINDPLLHTPGNISNPTRFDDRKEIVSKGRNEVRKWIFINPN